MQDVQAANATSSGMRSRSEIGFRSTSSNPSGLAWIRYGVSSRSASASPGQPEVPPPSLRSRTDPAQCIGDPEDLPTHAPLRTGSIYNHASRHGGWTIRPGPEPLNITCSHAPNCFNTSVAFNCFNQIENIPKDGQKKPTSLQRRRSRLSIRNITSKIFNMISLSLKTGIRIQ